MFWIALCTLSSAQPLLVSGPIIAETGPHDRIVQQVWQFIDLEGNTVLSTNSYVELATGLNYFDHTTGQWRPANAEFELTRTGHYIARQTQHQVILSPELAEQGAVDLLAPDGVRLRSTILGLAVVDPDTGKSALLAGLKPTQPDWIAPDQVLYADAFDTVAADVRYSIGLDRFEQDIILREQIPPDVVLAAGIDPRSARLVLMTEFFDPPQPAKTVRTLSSADGTFLTDEELQFGVMRIGRGTVFRADETEPGERIQVGKSWEQLDGRQFLIESVQYLKLGELLDSLPMPDQTRLDSVREKLRRTAKIDLPQQNKSGRTALAWPMPGGLAKPAVRQAQADAPAFKDGRVSVLGQTRRWDSQTRLASKSQHQPGVVLDYVFLNSSQTNYTFKGDTTYYLTGAVELYGTTTLEGGAVLKYSTSGSLDINGPGDCKTGLYRPVVFTAKDDNTVGETISGSTGTPSGYYGNPAIHWDSEVGAPACNLSHLRLAWANSGVVFEVGTGHLLEHVQFVNCQTAIRPYTAECSVRNALFTNTVNAISGISPSTVRGEHWTVNRATALNYNSTATVYLTNSLLVNVTGQTNFSGLGNVVLSSANGVFEGVGAGYHYLSANSSYRNAGTTNINSTLANDLNKTTTYPPIQLTGLVTTQTRLDPQAARDTDLPDLGYHYPPIDYAVGTLTITNSGSLTLGPGVAIAAFADHGLRLENYGSLLAEGTPKTPVRLFRYNVVQEQPINWGSAAYEPTILTGPAHDTLGGDAPPAATLRFVEFSGLGGYGNHLYTGNGWFMFKQLSLQDCAMWGGKAQFSGTTAATIGLTNNLFARTANKYYAWPQLSAYNNLFWGGSNRFDRYSGGGTWTFRDNAFHDTGLTNVNASVVNDHNGYLGVGQCQIGGSTSSNVAVSTFTYTTSHLGGFYHVSTNLVNAGSRSASAAGLYHHTVRADQTKETNSIVDIGFHYVAADEDEPLDTDDDGVADYSEDLNGNGVRDPGETDYQNPVSYDNCRLDGEVKAAPPELFLSSYECEAALDYDTVPRNGELPDKKFAMDWAKEGQSAAQQMAMFVECLQTNPPPETIVTNANDYNWPPLCPGTMTQWTQSLNGTRQTVLEQPSPRPPCSDSFLIPAEKCFNFTLPMQPPAYQPPFTGSYSRTASTVQKLCGGGSEWPKPKRSVVLQCLAIDKTSGDSLRLESGGILWGEPDNRWIGSDIDPVTTQITVYGERVNADNTVMIQLPVGFFSQWPAVVTPGIQSTWYMWELNFGALCSINRLTWSRHPNCASADVQKAFDEGAKLLAEDDDELVKEGDPRLNNPTFNQQDDVPTYIEFLITKAKCSQFPSDYKIGQFTNDFTIEAYNNIRDDLKLQILADARFANVKLVTSIIIYGIPRGGSAAPGSPGIVLARAAVNGITVAHEFGHGAGLEHRGFVVPPPPGNQPNPGDYDDPTAIMHWRDEGGKEVNRFERGMFCGWHPQRWDE